MLLVNVQITLHLFFGNFDILFLCNRYLEEGHILFYFLHVSVHLKTNNHHLYIFTCSLESFSLAGKFAAVRVKISALEKAVRI